jgi:hypothetical protein
LNLAHEAGPATMRLAVVAFRCFHALENQVARDKYNTKGRTFPNSLK